MLTSTKPSECQALANPERRYDVLVRVERRIDNQLDVWGDGQVLSQLQPVN